MSETIGDIVREMRESCERVGCHFSEAVYGWSDRIEAAYKRDFGLVQRMPDGTLSPVFDQKIRAKNAGLRDALSKIALRLRVFAEDNLNEHQRKWLNDTRMIAIAALKGGAE